MFEVAVKRDKLMNKIINGTALVFTHTPCGSMGQQMDIFHTVLRGFMTAK